MLDINNFAKEIHEEVMTFEGINGNEIRKTSRDKSGRK
jgi:hypothetical protein